MRHHQKMQLFWPPDMVCGWFPINTEVSKGLLEIHGEPLIERLIRQLHEAEIYDIYIVVGFMKERYEYLIDEYGVELMSKSGIYNEK
ncbi:MAG: NTP transferase domain-containing protein [Eubacterium ramulus]